MGLKWQTNDIRYFFPCRFAEFGFLDISVDSGCLDQIAIYQLQLEVEIHFNSLDIVER